MSNGVRRPVVGLTSYIEQCRWLSWDRPAAVLPQSYVDSVAHAGGVPVLLPPVAAGAAEAIDAVDALVLSGGADVDPRRYGAVPHQTTVTRPDRDAYELALLRAALSRGKPVLAICRGMQLLNVACGGTLHQHLPERCGNPAHQPAPGRFGANRIRVLPGSRLERILGGPATVPCHHHQAVRALGAGLHAVAWAADGTVEALEHPGPGFVLGVQWHPEERRPSGSRLFAALVGAAREEAPVEPVPS
jgi:putative glutamine amidotransferase